MTGQPPRPSPGGVSNAVGRLSQAGAGAASAGSAMPAPFPSPYSKTAMCMAVFGGAAGQGRNHSRGRSRESKRPHLRALHRLPAAVYHAHRHLGGAVGRHDGGAVGGLGQGAAASAGADGDIAREGRVLLFLVARGVARRAQLRGAGNAIGRMRGCGVQLPFAGPTRPEQSSPARLLQPRPRLGWNKGCKNAGSRSLQRQAGPPQSPQAINRRQVEGGAHLWHAQGHHGQRRVGGQRVEQQGAGHRRHAGHVVGDAGARHREGDDGGAAAEALGAEGADCEVREAGGHLGFGFGGVLRPCIFARSAILGLRPDECRGVLDQESALWAFGAGAGAGRRGSRATNRDPKRNKSRPPLQRASASSAARCPTPPGPRRAPSRGSAPAARPAAPGGTPPCQSGPGGVFGVAGGFMCFKRLPLGGILLKKLKLEAAQ